MEGLKVLYSDDPTADEKIREDCVPGAPHVSFYYQAGVDVDFINPQPHSGLFETKLPVMPGDTPLKLAIRIVKHHRQIKGAAITITSTELVWLKSFSNFQIRSEFPFGGTQILIWVLVKSPNVTIWRKEKSSCLLTLHWTSMWKRNLFP